MQAQHALDLSGYAMEFRYALKDPQKFRKFLIANKKELTYWGLLFVSIGLIYFLISDGDFSFCYTLSAIIQMFGFILIVLKARSTKSVSGLSLNAFICYSVSFAAKVFALLLYDGYLPSDSTGDIVFRISEVLAFAMSLTMVYLIINKFKSTNNRTNDRVSCIWLIIPTLILAFLIHPSFNASLIGDIPWTFGLYLEALAMIPQLYLFTKKEGEIEVVTSHFVASQGFSRILAFIFWMSCYDELNEPIERGFTLFPTKVGYIIVLFQVIQILLFSDFLYEYIKSLRKGLPISLDRFGV